MRFCLLLLAACSDRPLDHASQNDLGVPPDLNVSLDLSLMTDCAPCTVSNPSTQICLYGALFDFVSNQRVQPSAAVAVSAYDPLVFLTDPSGAKPMATVDTTDGCYTFSSFPAPGDGLVWVVVSDPATVPASQRQYVLGAVSAIVSPASAYRVDAYLISRALVGMWSSTAGTDFDKSGAVVAQFFDAAPPKLTNLVLGNASYAAGVRLLESGGPAAGASYLATRNSVSPTAVATQAGAGVAIAPFNPTVGIAQYSGTGGSCDGGQACKWESLVGAAARDVILVDSFYSCNYDPTAISCQ